jgi:hypothetical protein
MKIHKCNADHIRCMLQTDYTAFTTTAANNTEQSYVTLQCASYMSRPLNGHPQRGLCHDCILSLRTECEKYVALWLTGNVKLLSGKKYFGVK